MIQVKIELVSAVTGKTSEIGRMYITNDGSGTAERGDYNVGVCRGGSTAITTPNGGVAQPTRIGKVINYPRQAYNVWRLISRALLAAFPEERTTKPGKSFAAEITPAVLEGLRAFRLRAERSDEVDNRQAETAAADWLDAAHSDVDADHTP